MREIEDNAPDVKFLLTAKKSVPAIILFCFSNRLKATGQKVCYNNGQGLNNKKYGDYYFSIAN